MNVYLVTIDHDKPGAFSSHENAMKYIEEKASRFNNNKLILKSTDNKKYWVYKDIVQTYKIFLEEVV